MSSRIGQHEIASQRVGEARRVVPHHRQPAACPRPVQRKGRDDSTAAGCECLLQSNKIGGTVGFGHHEMESGAVVPDFATLRRCPGGDVGCDPVDIRGPRTQPRLRFFHRRGRQIEHRDLAVAALSHFIDETGGAAADIYDRRFQRGGRAGDQCERRLCRMVPRYAQ